jgi:hypothetical protein
MANDKTPTFNEKDVPFAITTLFQSLITQLMQSKALTVEEGENVFDAALKRVKKAKGVPDAARLIEHLHDTLKWDEYYKWSAQQQKKQK